MNDFKTVKEVREALKNNCFYVYVVKGPESKFRVYNIKIEKETVKVKTLHRDRNDGKDKVAWLPCEINQLTQQ
jgi:thioredoxin-related protein